MLVEVNYNGLYEDSIIIEGETLQEIGGKIDLEIEKRKWEPKDCWIDILEE